LENFDNGFDCYATQAFNAPDGFVYAISWLGLPETKYATDQFGVQGALSMVKKLSLKDGKLYQFPVEEMKNMRQNEQQFLLSDAPVDTDNVFELELDFCGVKSTVISIMTDKNKKSALKIQIEKENDKITIIRDCEKRSIHVKIEKISIFVDKSIFEIFVNNGEKVLSGRIFPSKEQHFIRSINPIMAKMWRLKSDQT
jgi:beta-fructofuranosidase